ncbi:helix-turn-helix domain-containing protein [Fructobacillus ficulneus]|uniref:HTH cro/C1-type domain-containing protein n=1 Tax=Fructobacillus ficulneus TaxID=157463 RepID=A0A0K8MI55_9LACO|nr:helix-turn-helix transcriptional regulator [Fructobacillus ficulneus]GAO99868.1 hypothetical protein FFIC_241440 [Fructobacillus ficulneus]
MTELESLSRNVEKKFKDALWERNIKQVELAEMLHTSPAQLSRALKGNTTPRDIEIQKQAAKILGIDL